MIKGSNSRNAEIGRYINKNKKKNIVPGIQESGESP